jgi:hypothetical protein
MPEDSATFSDTQNAPTEPVGPGVRFARGSQIPPPRHLTGKDFRKSLQLLELTSPVISGIWANKGN